MPQYSVTPGCFAASVDLGNQKIDVPIEIDDGVPNARPSEETYTLLRDRGMTDDEIDELLWECEHTVPHYEVAVCNADGTFDVIASFYEHNDKAANVYADKHYRDVEWYVLRDGKNINALRY